MRLPSRRPAMGTVIWVGLALLVAAGCFAGWAAAPTSKSWVPRLEEALAAGRIPPHAHFTRVWLPRAAFANGCLAVVMAVMIPLARRKLDQETTAPAVPVPARWACVGMWAAVAFIAGTGAWSTAPRLHHSLWGDEENSLRRSLVGEFERTDDGQLVFDPVTWKDTFFSYRNPNNHVLFSLAARLSHALLAPEPRAAGDPYFSEWALRLPALIAGVLAVLAVAGLAATFEGRLAGCLAAGLLVLHPWWFRYATEARGYAFLLAGMPTLIICLVRGVRTGSWRWWWLAGALDFALLYTWPLSVHGVAAANLTALIAVWWRSPWSRRDRLSVTLRWAIASTAAAMVFLQLFLPHLIQLRAYLKRPRVMGSLADGGIYDGVSALFTGSLWLDRDRLNPLLTPWERACTTHPWLVALVGAGLLALLAAGVRRIWRSAPPGRVWLAALLLPAPLVIAHSLLGRNLLLPWYLMPALPGLVVVLAAGIEALSRRPTTSVAGTLIASAAAVALYGLVGAPQRARLRLHPIEPNREAALLVQPVLNPRHPDYQQAVLTGGFLMQISGYDPGVREFKTADSLRALLSEADRTGRDFAVTFGQFGLARETFPEIMRLLEDPSLFEHVATLPGLEAYCTRYVYRHRAAR